MSLKKITRRDFLKLAGVTSIGAVVAACAPAPTPAPPTAVPKPTTATTVAPTQAPKIGASLIGKLEGPTIIRDTAQFPKTFKEAPMLADLVKAGKLPEVAKRLPDLSELMVVKPLKEIGKYGGNWRRAFTGPGDYENGSRINSSDKPLFFDYTGTKIMPSLAKDWKISDDGKTITLYLRKGAKWSDGTPLTADAFVFWYEDICLNKDIGASFFEFTINSPDKQGVTKKIDDYTVSFVFPDPYPYFVYMLAGSTSIGAGFATRGAFQTWGGLYAPGHYLKQFMPKYSSLDAVNKLAKDAGFDNWVSLLKNKYSWALNPDLPVMTPWKTVSPINTPTWSMERNPYYWAVDPEGNQLPYIDKITLTLAETADVANLRGIAGEYDLQERHMALSNLPVFLDNAQKGNYTIHLDPAFDGSDAAIHLGNAYDADPEVSKWIKNKDFRHALSMGTDRDQLNEALWLGIGVPGSLAPSPDTIYSPGPEYNKKWCTLDIQQANALLDKIGLDKKDSEGYRLRTDGKGRLQLQLVTIGGQFIAYTKVGEMIKQQWQKIGIYMDVKETERTLAFTNDMNDANQMTMWSDDGSEMLFLFPRHALPVDSAECHMGGGFAKWYNDPKQGKKPDDPEMLRAFDLFRAAYGMKEADQITTAKELWKIIVEQQWSIGLVGQSPAFMGVRLVKNNMGNVPERQVNAQHARTPCTSGPTTFYFKS